MTGPNRSDMADSVGVVIPAAGSGERMGGERKQLRTLGGHPVWLQTLVPFLRIDAVRRIVLVVDPELTAGMRSELRSAGQNADRVPDRMGEVVEFADGGVTRFASVRAGVRALSVPSERASVAPPEWVLVHDAVRPFVRQTEIERLIAAMREHGAAALAVSAVDTLRRVAHERFADTVPRDDVFRMQTPQGAARDWFLEAYDEEAGGASISDEVELLQRAGRAVRLVRGSARNFKITTPADWELAQALWQTLHAS